MSVVDEAEQLLYEDEDEQASAAEQANQEAEQEQDAVVQDGADQDAGAAAPAAAEGAEQPLPPPAAAAAAQAAPLPVLTYNGPKLASWPDQQDIAVIGGLDAHLRHLLGLDNPAGPPLTAEQQRQYTRRTLQFQQRRVALPNSRYARNLYSILGSGRRSPLAELREGESYCVNHGAGTHTTSECTDLPSFSASGLSADNYFEKYAPKLLAHPASTNRHKVRGVLLEPAGGAAAGPAAPQGRGRGRGRHPYGRGGGRGRDAAAYQQWDGDWGAEQQYHGGYGLAAPAGMGYPEQQLGYPHGQVPGYGPEFGPPAAVGFVPAAAAEFGMPGGWQQQQMYQGPSHAGAGVAMLPYNPAAAGGGVVMQPWHSAAAAAAAGAGAGYGYDGAAAQAAAGAGYGYEGAAAPAAAGGFESSAPPQQLWSAAAREAQQQSLATQEQQYARQSGAAASVAVAAPADAYSAQVDLLMRVNEAQLQRLLDQAKKAGAVSVQFDHQKRRLESAQLDAAQQRRKVQLLEHVEQQNRELQYECELRRQGLSG